MEIAVISWPDPEILTACINWVKEKKGRVVSIGNTNANIDIFIYDTENKEGKFIKHLSDIKEEIKNESNG